MKLLDLTFPSPAENLACDEALLNWCETGHGEEVLRFWESPEYFIVVGYGNKLRTETNLAACKAKGIPIYRRCSGGGTVLQGPGCLNYSLILKITEDGPLRTIASANRFIMERNRAAIETALRDSGLPTPGLKVTLAPPGGQRDTVKDVPALVEVRGHTDLCLGNLKFSGNSQRRGKKFLLFHGTFLLSFPLALASELLPMPSRQPEYREHRRHTDFLINLGRPASAVKNALQATWKAETPLMIVPRNQIACLATGKYNTEKWNQKF
jgi:lipoate-protein ligase A